MIVIRSPKEWQTLRKNLHTDIGFVPTMGSLHQGHMSLIAQSKNLSTITVVSIFLNPTQFNNPQDLEKYPVQTEKDMELLKEAKVDYLFMPQYSEMYPDNYRYKLSEFPFSTELCGANRPGHFDGVLSVVMKLFCLIQPHKVYFGEKDFQQLQLIQGMIESFFLDIELISCPIIREDNGLALSSRNKRLSNVALQKSPLIYKEISQLSNNISDIKQNLESQGFEVDYITDKDNRRYIAVNIEGIRLIDNVSI